MVFPSRLIPYAARKDSAIPATPCADELGRAMVIEDRQSGMARARRIINAACGRKLQIEVQSSAGAKSPSL